MKTTHPYTFLMLTGIACCVWVLPVEQTKKLPIYQEAYPANSINSVDNQSVNSDTVRTESLSIEEGGIRFAVW